MNPFESYGGPTPAPVGCAAIVLPAPTNPNCPSDYNIHESEITDIWISPVEESTPGAEDWTATALPTSWESIADLNATAGLRHLTIIGDKPLAENRTATLAKRWIKVISRNHSINMDLTDMSEDNYEFIRVLQYSPKVAVWFRSYGNWVAGGEAGIVCDVDTAGVIWGRGEGTLMTGQVVFRWSNKFDPPAVIANNTPSPLKVVAKAPDALKGADVTKKEAAEKAA